MPHKKNKSKDSKQSKEEKKKTNSAKSQDRIYGYNQEHINALYKEKSWLKDVKFFKKVKISALAATKMLKHSLAGVKKGRKGPGGTPIEIMGLLVGKPEGETVVVMDACPLPVEGIEYKVEAAEEVQGYMSQLLDALEKRRKEAFVGWYHSHPFDVDVNPFYFLSSTDVSTQTLWQNSSPIWTAIVVDPLRSLAKQEPQLGCFRIFPADHNPPMLEGPDGRTYSSIEEIKLRWGASPNRYYQLQHSYFLSNFGRRMLNIMSRNNLWIRVLSSSSILEPENRIRFPERLTKAKNKLQLSLIQDPLASLVQARKRGSGYGTQKKDVSLKEGATQCAELAIEHCSGHASQISKNFLFNSITKHLQKKQGEKSEEKKTVSFNSNMEQLPVNTEIVLHGLQTGVVYNGTHGVIKSYNVKSGRYAVKITETGKIFSILPCNIMIVNKTTVSSGCNMERLPVNTEIVLHRLQTGAIYNGKHGVVMQSYNVESGRYSIKITETGNLFSVLPENIMIVSKRIVSSDRNMEQLPVDTEIVLHGLQTGAMYNGKRGVINSYNVKSGRYGITITETGEKYSVLPEKIMIVSKPGSDNNIKYCKQKNVHIHNRI